MRKYLNFAFHFEYLRIIKNPSQIQTYFLVVKSESICESKSRQIWKYYVFNQINNYN